MILLCIFYFSTGL